MTADPNTVPKILLSHWLLTKLPQVLKSPILVVQHNPDRLYSFRLRQVYSFSSKLIWLLDPIYFHLPSHTLASTP